MKRLYSLLNRALQHNEPVLLVGETGCGKTSVVQEWVAMMGKQLKFVNCHQNTDSSDFIGSYRPSNTKSSTSASSLSPFEWQDGPLLQAMHSGDLFMMDEISLAEDAVLERLNGVLESRSILVAEHSAAEEVVASDGFKFVATMVSHSIN
jgi:midasin